MPTFTYLGLSDKEKTARLEAQLTNPLVPPEKRGQPFYFKITKEDEEEEKEEKRKRKKLWLEQRKKEIIAGIEADDKQVVFADPAKPGSDEVVVFPKGKPVTLDEHHGLIPKLMVLCKGIAQKSKHVGHVVVQHENFTVGPDPKAPKAEPKG